MPRPPKDLSRFKKDLIELLQSEGAGGTESQIYCEMLCNVGQLRAEKLDVLELRLLNTAFKELRYALKVFKPYRSTPKAAVFGSARTHVDHANYKIAVDFGKKLAKKGWMLITGGASGIMEAAMRGAGARNCFGLNIMLPFEQEANPVIRGNPKLIFFKYFFTRKLMFLKESEATVLFPGGFGTFDEGFESFTLVQTGKSKPRPLVLIDPPGSPFWANALSLFKTNFEDTGLISPGDLRLMRHFQDPVQAVGELIGFYRNYHSSRFFKDRYLIRLRKSVPRAVLEKLSHEFRDIITKGQGGFEHMTDPREDDIRDGRLERIVFHFDRSSYSRLRQLIDRFNETAFS
ncbi:MAG: TIGR00730 family Rossman fold protein [Candidatus Omnitrophota bacterium]